MFMTIPNKIFVLDVDDTIIDTDKVKISFEKSFKNSNLSSQILWNAYDQVKKEEGFVDYQILSEILAKELNLTPEQVFKIFLHSSFKECLMPKALELIEYLQTLGKVMIFSQGHQELQSQKIKDSGIEEIIGKDNIQIIEQKKENTADLIKKLKAKGFAQIAFIEDRAEILDEVYKTDKNIQCYWIRNGKYKDILPQTSCVTFQSNSLEEIYKFIYENNTVDEVTLQNTELFKIKIGISPNQIKQLITFTHQDKDVQKFTSDLERFNSKKSFNNWLEKGKYIYSLVDTRDNLQGIIWFNEKTPPDDQYSQDIKQYKITSGIRIYGSARGKGLGKKLFSTALKHFKSTPEYKSIRNNSFWCIISTENIPSQKLHQNIGFIQVTKPNRDGKIVMVYS